MVDKEYFNVARQEAEQQYANASGRRYRRQSGRPNVEVEPIGGSGMRSAIGGTPCRCENGELCGKLMSNGMCDCRACKSGVRSAQFRSQSGGAMGGCTSTYGANYNPNATCDDGSCQNPITDCPPPPDPWDFDDEGLLGYLDAMAEWQSSCSQVEAYSPEVFNLLVDQTQEQPSCNAGCMDVSADNYNPSANQDGGNCVYGGAVGTLTGKKDPKKGMRSAVGDPVNCGCGVVGSQQPCCNRCGTTYNLRCVETGENFSVCSTSESGAEAIGRGHCGGSAIASKNPRLTSKISRMRSVTGRDSCGFYPVSGGGFKSQTGEEDIIPAGQIPYQMIYADYETFGTTTCATGIPFDFKCKCDYNNDGYADSLVPLEEVGTAGATIPNYPFPYTLQQSAVISQICCRTYPDGSNAACGQDQQEPTTGLGVGMTTTGKGRRPSGLSGLRMR